MWYEASNFGILGGAVYLNHTLINSICYEEENPTTVTASVTRPTPTPGQGASEPELASTISTDHLNQTSSLPQHRL
jgi:hypothetical protein